MRNAMIGGAILALLLVLGLGSQTAWSNGAVKPDGIRVTWKQEGKDLRVVASADRKAQIVIVVTYLMQQPFVVTHRIAVGGPEDQITSNVPLEFEDRKPGMVRIECFQGEPEKPEMELVRSVLLRVDHQAAK